MSKLAFCGLAALSLMFAACGGSDGDDVEDPIDARIDGALPSADAAVDAPGTVPIDAPMGGTSSLGMACTGEGQGTCAAGFECLNLQGGSGSWCSKRCTGSADLSCGTGYSGTGFPSCLLTVTPAGGGAPATFCTIICQDEPGAPTLCPGGAAQCNMTCPTPLACSGLLTAQGGGTVGRVCQ